MAMGGLIDVLIGVVIAGIGFFLSQLVNRVNRLEDRVSDTREKFVHKEELDNVVERFVEALHRMEDKLDRLMEK
jgi:hypothetical protein